MTLDSRVEVVVRGVERSGFGLRTSLKISCTEVSDLIHLNFVCVCEEMNDQSGVCVVSSFYFLNQ